MQQAAKPLVVVIAYFFDPAKAIGAVRPSLFYKYLRELGYDCVVITAYPPTGTLPGGVIFVPDRIAELWERREARLKSGMPLGRLPLPAQWERLLRRFFLPNQAGLIWYREAARVASGLIGKRSAVVFSTYPQLGTHMAGYALKRDHGVPWIADFRDPIASSSVTSLFPLPARLGLHAAERAVLRSADLIIANTEPVAVEWRRRPRLADKIHVIWNGFDPESQPRALPVPERAHKFIVHAGTLYGGRNANAFIASLARLLSSERASLPAFKVQLLGDVHATARIDSALYDRGVQEGWLEIVPAVSKDEALRVTRQADALLLLQPQSRVQVPAKLFEYLSIGRPILALVPRDSAVEWILNKSGIPQACLYEDDTAETADVKVRSFLTLSNAPVTPSESYLAEFDARRQTAHLARLIEQVAARS